MIKQKGIFTPYDKTAELAQKPAAMVIHCLIL
jgi:hypothetical protein